MLYINVFVYCGLVMMFVSSAVHKTKQIKAVT